MIKHLSWLCFFLSVSEYCVENYAIATLFSIWVNESSNLTTRSNQSAQKLFIIYVNYLIKGIHILFGRVQIENAVLSVVSLSSIEARAFLYDSKRCQLPENGKPNRAKVKKKKKRNLSKIALLNKFIIINVPKSRKTNRQQQIADTANSPSIWNLISVCLVSIIDYNIFGQPACNSTNADRESHQPAVVVRVPGFTGRISF